MNRRVTAITIPQVLNVLISNLNVSNEASNSSEDQEDAKEEAKYDAKALEDYARYQMGDAALADEIMLDRLLIETYQKSYIK